MITKTTVIVCACLYALPSLWSSLSITNAKGFTSNPIADHSGKLLTESDQAKLVIGTFSTKPTSIDEDHTLTYRIREFEQIIETFIEFEQPVGFLKPEEPTFYQGTFSFDKVIDQIDPQLAAKPIYIVIYVGLELQSASEIAVLKTNSHFEDSATPSPFPTLVNVSVNDGTEVIVGGEGIFTANASALDATPEDSVYSLAKLVQPPKLSVSTQATSNLDGSSGINFGTFIVGDEETFTEFTLENTGGSPLSNIEISIDGKNEDRFQLNSNVIPTYLPASHVAKFRIQFSPTQSGESAAILTISAGNADDQTHQYELTGTALSYEEDTDGDGLNDASEWKLESLGFKWDVSQPELVETLLQNSAEAGLHSSEQLQAEYVRGANDVLSNPNHFKLFTSDQLEAERNLSQSEVLNSPNAFELFTQEQLSLERSAGKQEILDNPNSVELFTQQQLDLAYTSGKEEVISHPEIYELHTDKQLDEERLSGQQNVLENPNDFSLYKLSDFAALRPLAPLIERDTETGKFKLTLSVNESSDLELFTKIPADAENVRVNEEGNIEFTFTSDKSFFRIESN